MTQEELARKIGKKQPAIAAWENGICDPRAKELPAIADALGCTIDELFGRGERHGAVSEDSADA